MLAGVNIFVGVVLSVCLPVSTIDHKLWNNFHEVLGRGRNPGISLHGRVASINNTIPLYHYSPDGVISSLQLRGVYTLSECCFVVLSELNNLSLTGDVFREHCA